MDVLVFDTMIGYNMVTSHLMLDQNYETCSKRYILNYIEGTNINLLFSISFFLYYILTLIRVYVSASIKKNNILLLNRRTLMSEF